MRRIGFHFINIMSNENFINDNITYANGQNLSTVVLDNGYLYIILRYGILVLFFISLLRIFWPKKIKKYMYTRNYSDGFYSKLCR